MLDALYKDHMDRLWDRAGAGLGRAGVSPDAVTWAGLALNMLNALAFLFHRNTVVFGLVLAASELLDSLDGAVARTAGRETRAGAHLDTITDRYREIVPLLAVAQVTGYWALCFLAATGSLLVSYGAARESLEEPSGPVGASGRSGSSASAASGRGLPDLFERFERVALLCSVLVLAPLVPAALFWGLCALALGSHATALQRFARVWRRLRSTDRRA